ncbi:conserved Plasmodium protein, unknown function [Plasmodium ovale wallikeri]|uniref:Xrn1 N-terminal domain-containing protein n=2 Tax=Plasmodium ovale TaxID=36330 RepID=A0A1A8YLK5_PLAOA|nr:conserved Plasmodium protein, unknown function [Plasmodium ovale wallikeri]SBT32401.1 conserved Plasmodium protein, unknown function [Plasmodium ovale wallikeri]SBT75741.1 5'-3' exonuclease, putative [Plasmodium ovale]
MHRRILLGCAFSLAVAVARISCGIPGLHKWVISNFPSCVKVVNKDNLLDVNTIINLKGGRGRRSSCYDKKDERIPSVDNLLFDMNQLLHKANVRFCNYNTYFFKLSSLIKNVLNKFKPRKNVVFAIDGICPFSKLRLQIKRRAKDKMKEKEKEKKEKHINDITCGSVFIDAISKFLSNYVKFLISLQRYDHVNFFISTHREVGEGELKLMNWVKNYVKNELQGENTKANEKLCREVVKCTRDTSEPLSICKEGNHRDRKEDETFVIVGADADLLLQCLALKNVQNVYIYTYQTFLLNMGGNADKKENHLIVGKSTSEVSGSRGVSSSKGVSGSRGVSSSKGVSGSNEVSSSIGVHGARSVHSDNNFGEKQVKKKKIKVLYNLKTFINLFLNKYPESFRHIRRDMLILFILKGNDYLPKIREGNFSLFFEAYFKMLEGEMGKGGTPYQGFLNEDCSLNRRIFLKFLNQVQKMVNFASHYMYNVHREGDPDGTNDSGRGGGGLYLPLSLLNEMISKRVVRRDDILVESEKEKDVYKCTLTYLKNKQRFCYSGLSKKKKISMHIASYDFLKNEFPTYLKYVDLELFREGLNENRFTGENTPLGEINPPEEKNYDKVMQNREWILQKGKKSIARSGKFATTGKESLQGENEKTERDHLKMEVYLTNMYIQYCKNEKNYEQEMKICENYLEGVQWLVEMYTKTYCINFNFFYKYLVSPSLLSLYYHLSQHGDVTKQCGKYQNCIKNINLNIFKNNYEYYNFINFCVTKYNDMKSKLKFISPNGEQNAWSYSQDVKDKKGNEKNRYFKKTFHVVNNKYFENIYNILFSTNINIVKENIQKVNEILKKIVHKKKIIHYYWDMYAKRVSKFYKIIFYKSTKIYVTKVCLFRLNFEGIPHSSFSSHVGGRPQMELHKNNGKDENCTFDIENNYVPPVSNVTRRNRIFSRNQESSLAKKNAAKRVVKVKRVQVVFR